MVEITIDGKHFLAALEPDGRGGHWFRFTAGMSEATGAYAGDDVLVSIELVKQWPDPEIPADLDNALASDLQAFELWKKITPMARWEWIRWIRSTKQPETRKRRIEAACDKLRKGNRRPCCFNRNSCTEPAVSNNGILLES